MIAASYKPMMLLMILNSPKEMFFSLHFLWKCFQVRSCNPEDFDRQLPHSRTRGWQRRKQLPVLPVPSLLRISSSVADAWDHDLQRKILQQTFPTRKNQNQKSHQDRTVLSVDDQGPKGLINIFNIHQCKRLNMNR